MEGKNVCRARETLLAPMLYIENLRNGRVASNSKGAVYPSWWGPIEQPAINKVVVNKQQIPAGIKSEIEQPIKSEHLAWNCPKRMIDESTQTSFVANTTALEDPFKVTYQRDMEMALEELKRNKSELEPSDSRSVLKQSKSFTRNKNENSGYNQVPIKHASGFNQVPTKQTSGFVQAPTKQTSGYNQAPTKHTSGFNHVPTKQTSGFNHVPTKQTSGYNQVPTKQTSGFVQAPTKQNFIASKTPVDIRSASQMKSSTASTLKIRPNYKYKPKTAQVEYLNETQSFSSQNNSMNFDRGSKIKVQHLSVIDPAEIENSYSNVTQSIDYSTFSTTGEKIINIVDSLLNSTILQQLDLTNLATLDARNAPILQQLDPNNLAFN